VVDGKPLAVRVSGNRIANDDGVLRHWAKAGYGVTVRVAWDIQRELETGELETVLDEFVPDNANLYAVTAGGISSPRVRTFIDYLVEEFL
jgi:DNA-binding transcriptional LysR family regulator